MTWTRLPDDFTDRPAMLELDRSARLLHIEALVWCNRLLTDGVIHANALRRVSDSSDLDRDTQALERAGLWTPREDGSWQVEWSDQESADAVQQRREDRNARQRRYNERKRQHASGDHSKCDPRFCPHLRNASPEPSHNGPDDVYPARPVPSRPDPVGEGQGQSGSAAASATAPAARQPQRTSSGWLATLDAAALAELPWEVGQACPHDAHGWEWQHDGSLRCALCDKVARGMTGDPGRRWAAQTLTERRSTLERMIHPPEVWQHVHAEDLRGVSLVFDLASVLFKRAGPATSTAEDVIDLAGEIYQRSIHPHRLGDTWAAHRHQQEDS